jgi:hypothetical protein
MMDSDKFIEFCKDAVRSWTISHLDKSDVWPTFGIYVVWSCKILGNNKALLSTTLTDGMYFEVTYNGDKNEYYFDAYKKFANQVYGGQG